SSGGNLERCRSWTMATVDAPGSFDGQAWVLFRLCRKSSARCLDVECVGAKESPLDPTGVPVIHAVGGGSAHVGRRGFVNPEPPLRRSMPTDRFLRPALSVCRSRRARHQDCRMRAHPERVPMRAVPANLLALILAAVAAGAQQRLADVDPRAFDPSPGSLPRAFAPLGNHVLFCAEAPSSMGLWRSDGRPGGTTRIAELIMPFDLDIVPIGTRAVFVAFGGNTLGLWSTDGTAAGTVQVRGGLAFVPERSDLFVR